MLNSKNYSKVKSFNFFLPIAFILTIIPLFVRMTVVNLDINSAKLWGVATKNDLYSQNKAFYLMIFSILLIIISIVFFKKIFVFNKKDTFLNYILISSSVFFIFTLLSSVFSKYKEVSFFGTFDRAEGLITLTCYMVLFIYSIYTFKTTKNYKYITIPLLILVSINAFLGIFQYVGQDLLKTPLGNLIAIPSEYNINSSQINLTNGNNIYGTLMNSNYVGSFVSIVLPIFFCLTIFEDEIMDKIIMFIGTCLSIWLLFGSNARSGIIGISCACIFGIIVFWKLLIKKWKAFLIVFATLLILLIGINIASKGAISQRLMSTLNDDIITLFKNNDNFDYRDSTPVKDIKHIDKTVQVVLPNNALNISYENNTFVFKDSQNQVIPYVLNDKIYTTADKSFSNFSFRVIKFDRNSLVLDTLILNIDSRPLFMFRLKNDKSIHFIDSASKEYTDVEFPETFGFKGEEKIGSSRGYIWSRSIPLLKDNLILGSGPDTFSIKFPQHDFIGKYYAFGDPNQVVDKPHNLYLQIAIDYGFIALIGFLCITFIYIVDSLKLYAFKKYYEKADIFGVVTFLGIIGYLFSGLFNDSVVSVAPIFWIILGVGVSLNYMNRKAYNLQLSKKAVK